jgi:peptide/nickel transport system permease protein
LIAYIIRRILYSIPILVGVNLIVFALFFFVNTPDDMARLHLGMKRVTREQMDGWQRERALDLPYFWNAGWKRIQSLTGRAKENRQLIRGLIPGSYRFKIESPENLKLLGSRNIAFKFTTPGFACQGRNLNGCNEINLAQEMNLADIYFEVTQISHGSEMATIELLFQLSQPALAHRIILEYKTELPFLAKVTDTIFFQRSLKMLFFQYGKSDDGKVIADEISKRIIPSLSITLPAFILALFLDIFFAMLLAFFRGTYIDTWGVFLCVLGMSISTLFYIIGGQVIFGKILRIFPISGFDYGLDSFKFIVMPIAISIIAGMGGSVRFYRTIFLEEINRDYVRTARAKGLPQRAVLFIHILKNAMIPILTGVVVVLPLLFIGSLLLESFFAIPGMGSYLIDAITQQDFAVVQAMVSLGAFLYIVGLLLTDLSYTVIDPRVTLS